MGIFSIFLLPIIVFLAVMIYRASKQDGFSLSKRVGITFLFLLPFTYDIVITNILGAYYCLIAPPHPKTKIIKKVEYPISIYWEDSVYPGFNKEDRKLMIINYLDGKHLKTMALNGPDGKIYVYSAKEGDFKSFKYDKKFKNRYTQYTHIIMQNEKVYTKQTMPKTNYTVTFNEIPLNSFSKHFLYSDETKVIENNTSKVIAYNRRYMRFFYNIFPDFEVGNLYYSPDPVCGERISLAEVTFEHNKWNFNNRRLRWVDINQKLYNKYIKGEK